MKRMNKTAIALATAGALGFGITPMADAQPAGDADWGLIDQNKNEAFVPGNAPAEGANPDNNAPLPGTAQPGPTGREKKEAGTPAGVNVEEAVKKENPYPGASQPLPSTLTEQPGPNFRNQVAKTETGTPSPEGDIKIDENGNPYPGASQPLPSTLTEQPGKTFENGHVITKKVGGKTLVLFESLTNKDEQFYLEVNEKGQPVRDGKVVTDVRPATVDRTEDNILPIVLGVLGGLAGLGLVIAGVNYWVNKDGNLVTDPNKVNEPSTPADAENTKKIVGENAEEVAKQLGIDPVTGQPVDGQRGIGASTGVNKIPAALLSLLLASVLGAAAFVFGRRQLV